MWTLKHLEIGDTALKNSREITSRSEYEDLLTPVIIPVEGTENDIASKRLEHILDIRKFEIDLYWRRAAYFWSFIAAALTGYGLTVASGKPSEMGIMKFQFVIICFGLIFSLAWYLVNKGSKYWQENWEKHMDLTEDKVIGPLYKTTISKKSNSSFWNPTKAYAVSVSKINQILSLFVLLVWICIMFHFLSEHLKQFSDMNVFFWLIAGATISMILYLLFGTGTAMRDTEVHFCMRDVIDKNKRG